ncbi:nucleotidyltransferase family protein [Thalassotalea agarivorans]|uniref:Molybdenum cofactor cytidylyltransferase n=1 Tax=Thalassotalea agarivorans TaxID=349064 RepID=A0A1H9ZGL8_THASX|nr:nucleotidyltransferase family protein [Thalassotalea agarivorans]SES80655.1 molybdenum cofactor cytidylyltransferase [Thalassotalea agarivorans]
MHIHLILLAAGASKRLGQPKQLIDIGNKALIVYQIEKLIAAKRNVQAQVSISCVLGANHELCQPHITDLAVDVVINQAWQQGMSTSLQCGIKHAPKADAYGIVLVDQYALKSAQIEALIKAYVEQPEHIHLAASGEQFSPPAIFSNSFIKHFASATGDKGAKPVLYQLKDLLALHQMPEAFIDLDTKQQLKQLEQFKAKEGRS